MSPLLLAAVLSAAPGSAPPTPDTCEIQRPRIGPADAPVLVTVYLDPISNRALGTWSNLRALVGEMDGSVRSELVIVRRPDERSPRMRKPQEDRVRLWAMAVASQLGADRTLEEIDRLGWETVAASLGRPDQRKALEKRLGVETSHRTEACLDRALTRSSEDLALTHLAQLGNSTARPPIFAISVDESSEPRLIANDPSMRMLRPQVELTLQDLRSGRRRAVPHQTPSVRGSSTHREHLMVSGGMRVGGPGLTHELLLYADGERDPTLTSVLPPAIALRRKHPGVLSIQIVARGRRPEAVELRGRLCAAVRVGLEMEYLQALAGTDPSASDLSDRLDGIAERENCPAADRDTNDRGAFLDGAPASRADLERLDVGLAARAQRSRLRWFWLRPGLR